MREFPYNPAEPLLAYRLTDSGSLALIYEQTPTGWEYYASRSASPANIAKPVYELLRALRRLGVNEAVYTTSDDQIVTEDQP